MAAETPHLDPIHQFGISRFLEMHPMGVDASFTNASLFMVIVLAIVSLFMVLGTASQAIVPGRMQSMVEAAYEFIAGTVRQASGEEGMRFFPFVFSLFMFVLFSNVIGLIPYTFTVTSQIVVTFSLAVLVLLVVIGYGIAKHGLSWFKLFVPSGVPAPVLVILIPVEIISFLSRPVSLSVRLFANMLAGHITLQVFGGFMVLLLGSGALAVLSILPLAATVAMYGLELMVACLQAFVFAVLTCVYINDALHPGH